MCRCRPPTNKVDADYVSGRPWVARMGTGLRRPRVPIPGIDVAGEVESLGADVARLRPGDRVFADIFEEGSGAWAEYVAVSEAGLTPIPAGVSFEDAACAPSSGIFAIHCVRDKRPAREGIKSW